MDSWFYAHRSPENFILITRKIPVHGDTLTWTWNLLKNSPDQFRKWGKFQKNYGLFGNPFHISIALQMITYKYKHKK